MPTTPASSSKKQQVTGDDRPSIWDTAIHAFTRDTAYFAPRHLYFGLVAALGFPGYFVVWKFLFPQPYENLSLRVLGAALFVPIILTSRWPDPLRRYFPAYWYGVLIFALPFFFTFMLFKNNGCTVWQLSALVALFMMILLLDWLNLMVHISLGVAASALAYYWTTPDPAVLTLASLEYLPIFLFAIVMGLIVNYSSERLKEERRQAMLAAAGTVAHELRTPLLGIKSGASGLRQYLPTLLKAYREANRHDLIDAPIRAAHLDSMEGVLERIEMEADRSNTIIDMLLVNVRGSSRERHEFSLCSMAACVETALQRYPFATDKERALIQYSPVRDFQFLGSELLTVHLIFNLLKNALRHIAEAGKGRIYIELRTEADQNILIFGDTGAGIRVDVLPHIFDRFYSWPQIESGKETTGIGLAFCREVAQAGGGDIKCRSVLGEFTEFAVSLPKIPTLDKGAA